jgi:pseudouridine-5'-phosphate glycosidase
VQDVTKVDPEVAAALDAGQPVVALESTIISHGLPRPNNLRIAGEIEAVVRKHGAVPATIAVLDGTVRIGLDDRAIARIAGASAGQDAGEAPATEIIKISVRDLVPALVTGRAGATTVASTAYLAHSAGIEVFATGGLGGVHRGARQSWDESADLYALAETPITVVCAGVKSILDVPATLERLETLSIGVVGFRTDRFPGFHLADSGLPVPWRLNSAAEIAAVMALRRDLGVRQALVVANPLPEGEQLDPVLHDRVLADALAAARAAGISGKEVTPYLLAYLHEHTDGASLEANVRLVLNNAALAAQIAVAYAQRS